MAAVSRARCILVTEEVDGALYKRGRKRSDRQSGTASDTRYGRAAGFIDKWGNQWWLNDPAGPTSHKKRYFFFRFLRSSLCGGSH